MTREAWSPDERVQEDFDVCSVVWAEHKSKTSPNERRISGDYAARMAIPCA